jgi:hypothetical protein
MRKMRKMNTTTLAVIGVLVIGLAYLFMSSTMSLQSSSLQAAVTSGASKPAGLTVISPNGGEKLVASSTQKITWSGGATDWNVSMQLMNKERTKTVKTITAKTANAGSYSWFITSDIPPGSYYLRIACVNCKSNVSGRTDFSDASFAIAHNTAPVGPVLTMLEATTVSTNGDGANDDLGTFTIKFRIAAVGAPVYVASLVSVASTTTVPKAVTMVQFDRAGVVGSAGTSANLTSLTIVKENAAWLYEVPVGTTADFMVTGTAKLPEAGLAGKFRMSLLSLGWTTDSSGGTPFNTYDLSSSFSTSYFSLN